MWKRKPKLSKLNRPSSRLQVEGLSDRIVPTATAGGLECLLAESVHTSVPADQDAETVIDTTSFDQGEIADPIACYFLPPSEGAWCGTGAPGWVTTEDGGELLPADFESDGSIKVIDYIPPLDENGEPIVFATAVVDAAEGSKPREDGLIESPIFYAMGGLPFDDEKSSVEPGAEVGDGVKTGEIAGQFSGSSGENDPAAQSDDNDLIYTLSFQTEMVPGEDSSVSPDDEGILKDLPAAEDAAADTEIWNFGTKETAAEQASEEAPIDETSKELTSRDESAGETTEETGDDPEVVYMTGLPSTSEESAKEEEKEVKEETPAASEASEDDADVMTMTGTGAETDTNIDTQSAEEELGTGGDEIFQTSIPVDGGIDLVKGSGQGTYTTHTGLPDLGKEYSLQGTGTIPGVGQVSIAGEIRTLGNVRIGNARGMLTVTTTEGSLTLSLLGPEQAGYSSLPDTFAYRVVGGSGAFMGSSGKGTLKLTLQANSHWAANLYFDHLVGTGTGTYTIDNTNQYIVDAGMNYLLQGTVNLGEIGETTFSGNAHSLGFVYKGQATGQLTLSNPKGTLNLLLKGPEQNGNAPLPKTFEYTVQSATGDFTPLMPKGQFILILKPDGTVVCTFGELPTGEIPGGNSDRQLGIKVDSFYTSLLNRQADPQGRAYWVSVLKSGVSAEEVVKSLMLSSEYGRVHGNSQAQYIKSLYTKLLGREASEIEVTVWTQNWNAGLKKEGVLAGIQASEEAIKYALKNLYQGYLHREADPKGLATWVKGIQSGAVSLNDVAMRILNSPEYLAKTAQGYTL